MLVVVLVLGVAAIVWWQATLVHRERQRIAAETLLADWQLRAVTRAAMQRMLDVARQHSANPPDR